MGTRDYSTTAASNLSVGGISIAEGWARASVNNAYRAGMADIADLLLDLGGATPTTGSGNAYLLSLPSAPTAYAENMFCLVRFHATNTGAATLNVNGIGTKDIKKFSPGSGTPVATEATDIRTGRVGMLVYLATPNAFILLNPGDYATLDEDGLIEQDTQFLHPDPPSALARPWVNRGREMCSPFDIITNQSDQDEILSGAGTFDATTQLQEAFLWAKRVEFPGGITVKPCFLISGSLRMQNDQVLRGNGCRIALPSAGWDLNAAAPGGVTDNYGMFNGKDRSRWRIEGFDFHYPATMTAVDHNHIPKAVYYENSIDCWVTNNLFQGCQTETVWGGGSIDDCHRLHINHNAFIDCGHDEATAVDYVAIQLNFFNGEVIGNTLLRPGVGVGNSGLGNVVMGNVIDDPWHIAIGIGDNYSEQGVIVGNRIRMYSHPTKQRHGFFIDDGVDTPSGGSLTTWEGNYIHLAGTFGEVAPIGMFVPGPKLAAIGKNIITGSGQFTGVLVVGKYTTPTHTHARVDIDGLTVRALSETGPCFGVQVSASDGDGGHAVGDVTVTARLRNITVEGLGGLEHFGYDTQTANFTNGATVSGASATATIVNQTDYSATTGILYIRLRSGTFTEGETITDSSGGSARMSSTLNTSSYAYHTAHSGQGVFNGTYDHCWKTGGVVLWEDKIYLNSEQNNVPMISVAASTIVPA